MLLLSFHLSNKSLELVEGVGDKKKFNVLDTFLTWDMAESASASLVILALSGEPGLGLSPSQLVM